MANIVASGYQDYICAVLQNDIILKKVEDAINSNSASVVREGVRVLAAIMNQKNFEVLDLAIMDLDIFALIIQTMVKHFKDLRIMQLALEMIEEALDFE